MIPSNIGYHENPTQLQRAKKAGITTVQVMIGNPRTYNTRPIEPEPELDLICHGPYVTSLLATPTNNLYHTSVKYLSEITDNCLKSGIKRLVMHLGGMTPGASIKETTTTLMGTLTNWGIKYWGKPITLCLENDSGSKNGRLLGTLKFIVPLIKYLDSPQIRLCLDTEHAHAAGLDLTHTDTVAHILEYAEVVHLNACPYNVERGSHVDRHSDTLFTDAYHPEEVYRTIHALIKPTIPIILERANLDVAMKDMHVIERWVENG